MAHLLPLAVASAVGSLASKAVGSLIGGKKTAPAPAPVEAGPRVMPLADDGAVRLARRRSLQKQLARGGRTSTMLTGEGTGTTLGG
jgi:hypothetical protein